MPTTKRILFLSLSLSLAGCDLASPGRGDAASNLSGKHSSRSANEAISGFDTRDLNEKTGACEDLFEHVNRNWFDSNPMPPDKVVWGMSAIQSNMTTDTLLKILESASQSATQTASITGKLGSLYSSGMDKKAIEQAGLKPIATQLANISAISSKNDVVTYIISESAHGNGQVFSFGPMTDYLDSTKVIASVSENTTGLPTKDYYTSAKYKSEREAYVNYMKKIFSLSGSSDVGAADLARRAISLETKLANSMLSSEEEQQADNSYNPISIESAQKITPHFPWREFIDAQGIKSPETISLTNENFFRNFDTLLNKVSVEDWKAYLKFKAIDKASPWLSDNYVQNYFNFHNTTLRGQPSQESREKQVLKQIQTAMGEALGQLYVQRRFDPEDKAKSLDLIEKIRSAMKVRIENSSWMGLETKKNALKKLAEIRVRSGYPDKWRDWSGLALPSGSYYDKLAAAREFNYKYELAKIGKAKDLDQWFVTPQTLDAFYNPSDNSINVPAAMWQPPLFNSNNDLAVNLGGIGAFIGHEITHAFDDQGSKFDGRGNKVDWWTSEDRKNFEHLSEGLVNQFDSYRPIASKPEIHVNGRLTLGENIADFGGLNLAYTALHNSLQHDPQLSTRAGGYTPDQRLFFSWARLWRSEMREKQLIISLANDPHSPKNIRTNAAPSNMPAFAKAFSCKPTDSMVRDKNLQITIW